MSEPLVPVADDPSSRIADPARLAAVRALELLDTPPEEVFDRMTRLAAKIIGVPASFISLVDEHRDFYKSQSGMPEPLATSRELRGRTLCHYTLRSPTPLALDDVLDLEGFRDVPTVAGLGVRAYLGIPMRTAAGQNVGSFCAIDVRPRHWSEQDIEILTELAHSAMREIELRRALREARQVDRRKDVFVATLAHELRQPLNALMPAIALINAGISDRSVQRAREVATHQVRQLQRLVDDLLDAAGVATGKISLHPDRVDLRNIVEATVEGLAAMLILEGQSLTVGVPDTPVWVWGDAARLEQVCSNLITNAIKYTPAGGSIHVALTAVAGTARIAVRDSGKGISPEALPHVFDLFMQEETPQRAGLGIGLNLVRGLVHLHGGTVEALSNGAGQGCEFIVSLPLHALEVRTT